jgi:hypothetical protein
MIKRFILNESNYIFCNECYYATLLFRCVIFMRKGEREKGRKGEREKGRKGEREKGRKREKERKENLLDL